MRPGNPILACACACLLAISVPPTVLAQHTDQVDCSADAMRPVLAGVRQWIAKLSVTYADGRLPTNEEMQLSGKVRATLRGVRDACQPPAADSVTAEQLAEAYRDVLVLARRMSAPAQQRLFNEAGNSISVTVRGPDATTLHFSDPGVTQDLADQYAHDTGALVTYGNIGFTSLIYSNGVESYQYKTTPTHD